MVRKSCLLLVNSILIMAGTSNGIIPTEDKTNFDSNALNATDIVESEKSRKVSLEKQFVERIAQINSPIDLEYNKYVKKHILQLLKNPKSIQRSIEKSKEFFPIFDRIFDTYNIPSEINCLAIVESKLNPKATSYVGAKGVWQFMPKTARGLGMQVNSTIDERIDIYTSTEKAGEYLSYLHQKYDDWLLALAAYNCGFGNVNKALKKTDGKTFWDIKKYLPKETQEYIPKFIATVYLLNYHQEHGIKVENKETQQLSYNYDLSIEKSSDFWNWVNKNNLDIAEIKKINPAIKDWAFKNLKNKLTIRIPNFNENISMLKTQDLINNNIEFEEVAMCVEFDALYSYS